MKKKEENALKILLQKRNILYTKGETGMHFPKVKKTFAFLLVLLLILSITNASYPGNSFATETGGVKESALKAPLETEDVDITYPAMPKREDNPAVPLPEKPSPENNFAVPSVPLPENNPSEGQGVFMRHVAHMPKFKENPVPFTPNQKANTANQTPLAKDNAVPTVTSTVYQNAYPTVTGTVYQSGNILPQLFEPNKSVLNNVYHSNDLVFDSVVQHAYSVSNSVYALYPIRNKAGFYTVGFSPQSGQSLLSFSYGDANLLISPIENSSVAGKVYRNTILYENIYPNVNLRYTVEELRFKEDIFIQDFTGQSDFYFRLSVSNAVYQMLPNGTISFSEPNSGKLLFYMAKPYALDKKGNRCDSVYLQLTTDGLLKLSINSNWLKQAVYPIIIDPTINLAGSEIYQASAGFSSTQGQNNWYYEEQRADGNYYQMTVSVK